MVDSREDNFKSYKVHIDGLQAAAAANINSPSPRQRPRPSTTRTMYRELVIDVDSVSSDIVRIGEAGLDDFGLNAEDDETLDRIINGSDSNDSNEEEDTP